MQKVHVGEKFTLFKSTMARPREKVVHRFFELFTL